MEDGNGMENCWHYLHYLKVFFVIKRHIVSTTLTFNNRYSTLSTVSAIACIYAEKYFRKFAPKRHVFRIHFWRTTILLFRPEPMFSGPWNSEDTQIIFCSVPNMQVCESPRSQTSKTLSFYKPACFLILEKSWLDTQGMLAQKLSGYPGDASSEAEWIPRGC